MTLEEVMSRLEAMGTEQTKQTFIRHGAKEPLYGVKIGDLKKLVSAVKKDQGLARALYETGNSDAMYLAGLTVNPRTMDKETLEAWVKQANWVMHSETTVPGVAAESPFGFELAREWMQSRDELIAACGWSTYINAMSITPDEQLDLEEIKQLLHQVETKIHEERNRVRYTMNGFVIGVGAFVEALHEEAIRTATAIGKVHVHMGDTACKVPEAAAYIKKVEAAGKLGVKRKTCIC
ncbi:DNA alkylation repair protein [Paenibacillus sp. ACRRX]|uniref:DNA alkylation repair protein n=1 Tax=Paenibacillus sp. ACRRX TaxID=2918206 RepID=UPI001EF4A0FA|nr:DNA alkylation repair protein [Paenibacillus sp. ACRRX]MCG7408245.1 DNA alkylation repair protein [Paenibacillus sp. ACRRX]